MNGDRLRLDLERLSEEVTPVDLRDRVLKTSRRLGIRRAIATSATALVVLGAAAGTALALTPRTVIGPAPAASGSVVVTPSVAPTPDDDATTPVPLPTADRSGEPATTKEPARSTPPPAVDDDLEPTGIGPYRIGTRFTGLQTRDLLREVRTASGCDWVGARGLDTYHEPFLSFFDGRLSYLIVDSPQARTATGARVGMTLAQVKARHPDGRLVTRGDRYVWLTPDGSDGLMFRFDEAGTVDSIEAGPAQTLEFRFTDGEGC